MDQNSAKAQQIWQTSLLAHVKKAFKAVQKNPSQAFTAAT